MGAQAVSMAQFSVIGMSLGGDYISSALGMPLPTWYSLLKENKMYACLGAWLVGNMASSSLTNTGAFEIEFRGEQLWSKLEQHDMPPLELILSQITQKLQSSEKRAPPRRSQVERGQRDKNFATKSTHGASSGTSPSH